MDQSFSVDNFKKILSYKNRKGRNLEKEFFPLIFETTKEITEINKKINARIRLNISDNKVLAKLNEDKVNKKNLKQELIEKHLNEVSEKLLDPKFKIAITRVETDDKPVYTITKTAEIFLLLNNSNTM